MIIGLYVRRWHPFTGETREPISGEQCWKCDRPRPDLAHAVFEYVAAVLGAELERRVAAAVTEHQAVHGCGEVWYWSHGCEVAADLTDLLPDGMRPVAIG